MIVLNDQLKSHLMMDQHHHDHEDDDENTATKVLLVPIRSPSEESDRVTVNKSLMQKALILLPGRLIVFTSMVLHESASVHVPVLLAIACTFLAGIIGYHIGIGNYEYEYEYTYRCGTRIQSSMKDARFPCTIAALGTVIACILVYDCCISMWHSYWKQTNTNTNTNLFGTSRYTCKNRTKENRCGDCECECDHEVSITRDRDIHIDIDIADIDGVPTITDDAEMEQELHCRKRIQMALGSILAPSLSAPTARVLHKRFPLDDDNDDDDDDDDNDKAQKYRSSWNQHLMKWTQFAESHAGLMQDMEHAASLIRTVSSVRMGLGPLSPAVERVEEQSQSQSQSQSKHSSASNIVSTSASTSTSMRSNRIRMGILGAARMRNILYQSMTQQNEALRNIMTGIFIHGHGTNNDDASHSDSDHDEHVSIHIFYNLQNNEELYSQSSSSQPNTRTLTLRLLKACMKCNGQLLSKLLSAVLDPKIFHHHHHHHDCMNDNDDVDDDYSNDFVGVSIQEANEQRAYLRSCFHLEPNEAIAANINSTNTNTNTNTNPGVQEKFVSTCITETQKHFHASYALLVAFVKSSSSESNSVDVDGEDETEALWNEFSNSLQTVSHLCLSLKGSLFPNGDDENDNEIDTTRYDAAPSDMYPNSKAQDPMEYDDEGMPKVMLRRGVEEHGEEGPPSRTNKTIIFSGKGSKLPLSRQRKKDKSSTASSAAQNKCRPRPLDGTSIEEQPTLMDRSILIQELQSRLGKIELPEEFETSILNAAATGAEGDGGHGPASDHAAINNTCRPNRDTRKSARSTNFFTGVTGNVLMELKGAMAAKISADDVVCTSGVREGDEDHQWHVL
jgi:hypothetical protein